MAEKTGLIFENELKSDISSGNIANAYLFFGEDSFLKKYYSDVLVKKTAGLDSVFDYQNYQGGCNLQDVFNSVTQYPMMSERKCVILSDYEYEKASSADFECLLNIIGETSSTGVFILRFDSIEFSPKSAKGKKLVKAMEKAGGKVVQLNFRTVPELCKMLCSGALKRKCKMDSATAKYMVENVGNDISALQNELDKLCIYTGGGVIDKAAVDKISVKTVQSSVYDLNKKIFSCDTAGALTLLDGLYYSRIEPVIIFSTVAGAYVDMYRVSAGQKCGKNTAEIAKEFDYSNRKFLLDRAAGNLRKFDGKKLPLSFHVLLETDRQLKSFGGNERTVLEEMIVKLCFIIENGREI